MIPCPCNIIFFMLLDYPRPPRHGAKAIPYFAQPLNIFFWRHSEVSLIQLSGHMFGNQLKYPSRMWLTYPDFQLSWQLAWEWRCPDKWGSTVPELIKLPCYFSFLCWIVRGLTWALQKLQLKDYLDMVLYEAFN